MQRRRKAIRSPSAWLLVIAVLSLCAAPPFGFAQLVLSPTDSAPAAAPFEPTPTPSSVNRKLKQVDTLIADETWDEAIDLIESLQTEQGTQWIETAGGSDRFTTLSQACQKRLTLLPPAGLNTYRQRVDSSAKQLLEEGLENLDPKPLQRLVKEYFASSYGDNALMALGEIAFARGDMIAARRSWLRIDSRLVGPYGEPIELALYDVDPNANREALAQLWLDSPRPADLNTYPNSEIQLDDLLARLIITSLHDEQQGRAKAELRLLEAIAPETTSWFAGRVQPLASTLRALYESTFSNQESNQPISERIGPMLAWQWPKSLPYVKADAAPPNQQALQHVIRMNAMGQRIQFFQPVAQPVVINEPIHRPIVTGDVVAMATREGLKGWQLADGKPIPPVKLAQHATRQANSNRRVVNQHIQIINGRVVVNNSNARAGNLRNSMNVAWPGTLTACENQLYFATQPTDPIRNSTTRRMTNAPARLLGISPDEDGKIVLELSAADASETINYHFAGPPTIHGDLLYVVLSNVSARRELAVACYSISRSRLAWLTPIGSSEGGLAPQQYVSLQVKLGRDTAYLATDQGAVVALDSTTGEVRWLTRYRRKAQESFVANRDLSAHEPILSGDRLYIGPRDSELALALNTGTGRIVWSGALNDSGARLVAVTAKTVLFAGEQMEGLDPITGERRYLHPESKHAGLRGKGEGLLVGDEYFWPTRNEIQVLDLDTGALTRPPIDLLTVGSEGAILKRAGDRIVVAGATLMNVLGGEPTSRLEPIPQLSRLMEWRQPTGGPMLSNIITIQTTP